LTATAEYRHRGTGSKETERADASHLCRNRLLQPLVTAMVGCL